MRKLRERIALWIAPWLDGGISFGADSNIYRTDSTALKLYAADRSDGTTALRYKDD